MTVWNVSQWDQYVGVPQNWQNFLKNRAHGIKYDTKHGIDNDHSINYNMRFCAFIRNGDEECVAYLCKNFARMININKVEPIIFATPFILGLTCKPHYVSAFMHYFKGSLNVNAKHNPQFNKHPLIIAMEKGLLTQFKEIINHKSFTFDSSVQELMFRSSEKFRQIIRTSRVFKGEKMNPMLDMVVGVDTTLLTPPQLVSIPENQTPDMSKFGKCKVVVKNCRNLRPADTNGKSDPFVVVSFGKEYRDSIFQMCKKSYEKSPRKTKILKRTLNPDFDEVFEFESVNMKGEIYFDIFDWDRIGINDHLGTAVVTLNHISNEVDHDFTIPITEGWGTISVSIKPQGIGFEESEHSMEYSMEKTISTFRPIVGGQMRVEILSCEGIVKADILSGSSDPFCVVKLEKWKWEVKNDQKKYGISVCKNKKAKTKVIKKNLSPEFNETFVFQVSNMCTESIVIRVYDWDRIGKNDHIGTCSLPLRGLVRAYEYSMGLPIFFKDGINGVCKIKICAEDFGHHCSNWSPTLFGIRY